MVLARVYVRLLPLCADPQRQRVYFHVDNNCSAEVQGGGKAA